MSHSADFEFVKTPPPAPRAIGKDDGDCGVRLTTSPTIYNAILPADGAGSDTFSNLTLGALLIFVPYLAARKIGGGCKTALFFALFTTLPLIGGYWYFASSTSPRRNEKVRLPGRPVEQYVTFKHEADRLKYRGRNKIPLDIFSEMYFKGDADFNRDPLEVMEFRHDWASFRFTFGMIKYVFFQMVPEVIMHTRSQDEEQVRGHYDRGDDFYGFFLGPRMIYTSGLISDTEVEESLEQLQDNKLAVVCEKIGLKKGETLLDIGCGWGTLSCFASENYDAQVTGVTLGRNQTAWGNNCLRKANIPEIQSRILCQDYRDIVPPTGGFNKITCLEMAEHVGIRLFPSFMSQVYNMLDDDGVFYMQVSGLRKSWQYEDLNWGIFMNKYIFPGADASTPLGWYVNQMEAAGFEVKSVDTVGVHYSATLWRWYRNWLANKDNVVAKYGERWYRIWTYFLAYSTIVARQGSATCFQIVAVKNLNSTHRIEGIASQHGLSGARKACTVDMDAWAKRKAFVSSAEVKK